MTSPIEFSKSVYLGDRWCKRVIIDGATREILFQIDLISRVRGDQWNYANDEDIENGFLVLEGVVGFEFSPQGLLPNDWIELTNITQLDCDEVYRFEFSLGATTMDEGSAKEVILIVEARNLCLADANGKKFRA